MFDYRNLVRLILVLGAISAAKHVRASEQSTFGPGQTVYRLKYSTTMNVLHAETEAAYLVKAYRQSNYLVGQLAYSPRTENGSAVGAPLRLKEDVKVSKVKELAGGRAEVTYDYNGEVVLDREGLKEFTLYLPKDYEAIEKMDAYDIAACSFEPGYVASEDILSIYWTPFAKRCGIEHVEAKGILSPIAMKETYPDYPRLVKDGVISVAILVGTMDESSNNNPYGADESGGEYGKIVKKMKKMGFVRTESSISKNFNASSEETFEATMGKIKVVAKLVFGNSVYASEERRDGVMDFYDHYVKLAKESSYVVYSGHAGFMLESGSITFHKKYPLVLDQDRYQIFMMNGCQTADYAHAYFGVKGSKNLDLMVNVFETPVNYRTVTAMLDAISSWAYDNEWTTYSTIVRQMDMVDATLGVLGEQDNPTKPY